MTYETEHRGFRLRYIYNSENTQYVGFKGGFTR